MNPFLYSIICKKFRARMCKTITACCTRNTSSRPTAIPSHRRNVLPFHVPDGEPGLRSTDIRIIMNDVIRRNRRDLRNQDKVLSRKAIQRHLNLSRSIQRTINSNGERIDSRMSMAAESSNEKNNYKKCKISCIL